MPLGILIGQIIMNCGLELHSFKTALNTSTKFILLVGLMMISVFRAGGEVVQHTLLVRLLPDGFMNGFCVIIFSTHFITMGCNFLVPQLLVSGGADEPKHGM